ncbi:hypothetical protein C8F04DRAFT_1179767 [Mycena alexandri]|uniref:Uncharacterized protein n=1 Tax=Mycena alexandri TaxID=1745969 RepID=A0AAD6T2G3_9AGAR|nr:hypothetical protein C8F04DRAFT_1179767 [Mycena alexandri]
MASGRVSADPYYYFILYLWECLDNELIRINITDLPSSTSYLEIQRPDQDLRGSSRQPENGTAALPVDSKFVKPRETGTRGIELSMHWTGTNRVMFDATQQGVKAVQPAPGESVFEQVILIDPTEGSVETPEVRWQSAPMNGVMAIHADARSHGNLHADARSCGDARHRRGNGNSRSFGNPRRCTESRQPTPMHGVTAISVPMHGVTAISVQCTELGF